MAAYTRNLPLSDFLILLLKVTIAAFLMRASACTVNDILDRNFDAKVERTKLRPLAAKKLSILGGNVSNVSSIWLIPTIQAIHLLATGMACNSY
ncbi:prenyltransferase [Pyrrhoderma noxium]|uniref:Prenyltransferase n=1 Tax=Pyrrhoderma noxium TaxID=2282107 RepID=A0A286UIT2_9AGAM|nr:prenyltransferase [Pyrrhoderma noxium]